MTTATTAKYDNVIESQARIEAPLPQLHRSNRRQRRQQESDYIMHKLKFKMNVNFCFSFHERCVCAVEVKLYDCNVT